MPQTKGIACSAGGLWLVLTARTELLQFVTAQKVAYLPKIRVKWVCEAGE